MSCDISQSRGKFCGATHRLAKLAGPCRSYQCCWSYQPLTRTLLMSVARGVAEGGFSPVSVGAVPEHTRIVADAHQLTRCSGSSKRSLIARSEWLASVCLARWALWSPMSAQRVHKGRRGGVAGLNSPPCLATLPPAVHLTAATLFSSRLQHLARFLAHQVVTLKQVGSHHLDLACPASTALQVGLLQLTALVVSSHASCTKRRPAGADVAARGMQSPGAGAPSIMGATGRETPARSPLRPAPGASRKPPARSPLLLSPGASRESPARTPPRSSGDTMRPKTPPKIETGKPRPNDEKGHGNADVEAD